MPLPIYSTVTVESVEYTQKNNFAGQADIIGSLPRPTVESLGVGFDPYDDSVFAVGIHAVDPAIGSGDATNLDSLIGLKILEKGTYTDLDVPIFPAVAYPELTEIQSGQTFPPSPDGDTEVRAAIWETLTSSGLDPADFPDNADDVPDDLSDLIEPFAVSPPATISALDQNPALSPASVPRPTAVSMYVDNQLGVPIEELRVDSGSFAGGETITTVTGAPLPISSGSDEVLFENVAVVDVGTDVTVVALDGDGNQLGESSEAVSSSGEIHPYFASF